MSIEIISSEEVKINWSGEKAETRYINIIKQYEEIIQACKKVVRLSIDLSYSHIKQETVDRVIKELFYMPILEQDESRVFHHKFFDLRSVIVKVDGSALKNVDFVANFFHYYNIKEIEVSCDDIEVAYSFLKQSKEAINVERIQCESYFSKHFGVYSIESNSLFTEQTEICEGIYDQIEAMKVIIKSETYDTVFGRLLKCSLLRKLEIELVSLNSMEKDTKNLIQQLANNCKQLSKLTLKVDQDKLLPPIKMDSFQEQCQLEVQYLDFLKHTSVSQLFRKINAFVLHRQILSIPLFVELKDNELKLDLKSRVFSDEDERGEEVEEKKADEEKNDVNELMKFLNKATSELNTLQINFSPSQEFSPARWVQMLKIICAKENLRTVSLSCWNISRQLSALSLAKLVKSGKISALVNKSSLNNGVLDFQLHQLSHTVLNFLMEKNCLKVGASLFTKLAFTTDIIIGEFQPLSTYFKTANRQLSEFKILVTREEPDLMQLLVSAVSDSLKLREYFSSFFLSQVYRTYNDYLCLCFCFAPPNNMTLSINRKYELRDIIKQIEMLGRKKLDWRLDRLLDNELSIITNYNRNAIGAILFSDFTRRLKLLQELWNFRNTCIKDYQLPMQLSIFFKILAPHIPLNPYMLVCDLYYD